TFPSTFRAYGATVRRGGPFSRPRLDRCLVVECPRSRNPVLHVSCWHLTDTTLQQSRYALSRERNTMTRMPTTPVQPILIVNQPPPLIVQQLETEGRACKRERGTDLS